MCIRDRSKRPGWEERKSQKTFGEIASSYDAVVGRDELFMGIALLRRYFVGTYARGDVLEVAVGTGRNMKYYKPNLITSLTCVDRNREMLLEAKEKAGVLGEGVPVRFALANVERLLPVGQHGDGGDFDDDNNSDNGEDPMTPYGPALRKEVCFDPSRQQFDTIVESFGLCSCSDPVLALKVRNESIQIPLLLLLLFCSSISSSILLPIQLS